MQTSLTVRQVDRAEWEARSSSFDDFNYQQTWSYAEMMAARSGSSCEHVVVQSQGAGGVDVFGLASVRVKRLPLVGGGVAYVAGGPLTRNGNPESLTRLRRCLGALIEEYSKRRKLVLRIALPAGPDPWNRDASSVMEGAGLRRSELSRPYRTILLDTVRPLPEIRESLSQKWRNCLNAGERNGLTVVNRSDQGGFIVFGDMFRELIERKGFRVDLAPEFYSRVHADLAGSERLTLLLAEYEGETVAGQLSSMHGDTAIYLLGVSNEVGLKIKASYVLQWRTIEHARQRGLRWYDLGGIDPEGNPGVYHFKKGLGGVEVQAPGPFECRPRGLRGRLTRVAEATMRRMRR